VTTPPHPITPPLSRDELFTSLRLLRSRRVGPATFFRLIAEHGTAAAALSALPQIARAAGVEAYDICPEGVVHAELKAGDKAGARLAAFGTPDYPSALADLEDAPPLVWVKGNGALLARRAVAVIGARNASSLGLRMAKAMAKGLAEAGFVVVSGLARGIDAEAHRAALQGGTVAVVAGGIDVTYPPEHLSLQAEIGERGLLVSEQPPGLQPQARHFPRRNRLVSGLSRAVIVIEAASGSGSLITAKMALDQGREVMAVPGHPMDGRAAGCNMLIRDGALLVRGPEDVAEALGQTVIRQTDPAFTPAARKPATDLVSAILERLNVAPIAEDTLIRDLNAPPDHAMAELTTLELEGRIARKPGGLLVLVA
jgi:DNA processing protein